MKRIHGPVLSLVTAGSAFALAIGLSACAAKPDVGTSHQHTTGACGLQTTADFLHLQSTCSNVSSHSAADACSAESASYLQRYSELDCTLNDPSVGSRTITESTIRSFKSSASSFSAKTDCTRPVERAFNRVLKACLASPADPSGGTVTQAMLCGAAADVFKDVAPGDVTCTIAKSVLGRPTAVSSEIVQRLRDQAGADATSGGACGIEIENAFLKTELACSELTSTTAGTACRASVDAFTAAFPRANCHLAAPTDKVDAARLALLRAKADHAH